MKITRILFVTIVTLLFVASFAQERYARVIVPVADLREQPKAGLLQFKFDILQNTQVLYNECLNVLEDAQNGWIKVSSLLQQRLKAPNTPFVPYAGYVKVEHIKIISGRCTVNANVIVKDLYAPIFPRHCIPGCIDRLMDASIGTRFLSKPCFEGWCEIEAPTGPAFIRESNVNILDQLTPHEFMRDADGSFTTKVLETSKKLLGWVYFWGGFSAYNYDFIKTRQQLSGVDCSALVGISYMVNNLVVPRDAHDQFVKSRNITDSRFTPGDLFFFSNPSNPKRITHVVLYMGNELIVESTSGKANATRVASTVERFGLTTPFLKWGQLVDNGNFLLFWGRYIFQ